MMGYYRRVRRLVLIATRDHAVRRTAQFALLWAVMVFIVGSVMFEGLNPQPNAKNWVWGMLLVALFVWYRVIVEVIVVVLRQPHLDRLAVEELIANAERVRYFYDYESDEGE